MLNSSKNQSQTQINSTQTINNTSNVVPNGYEEFKSYDLAVINKDFWPPKLSFPPNPLQKYLKTTMRPTVGPVTTTTGASSSSSHNTTSSTTTTSGMNPTVTGIAVIAPRTAQSMRVDQIRQQILTQSKKRPIHNPSTIVQNKKPKIDEEGKSA